MKLADITPGAEVYYAPGQYWRVIPPKQATVVDPGPYRIIRRRQGAFSTVSYVPDTAGNAVLVDLDEGYRVRRCAVPARELRGLWRETLAATGRTAAGVKAHRAAMAELATSGQPLTGDDVLRLAATDEGVSDDTFVVLARVDNGRTPDGLVA